MMKIYFLILILFISSSLQSQTTFNQTSGTQLDYFKSHPGELKDKKGINIFENPIVSDQITIEGESNGRFFGESVSSAGDVNGDGFSDVIVGAWDYPGGTYKGRAYIFYGGSLMDTIADVVMTGESSYNYFGISVSTAGDVNGDGFSDVLVGAEQYTLNGGATEGRAYIFYGGLNMNNVADVIMTGDTIYSHFGISVSTAGDVNEDGFSDVIIGARGYNFSTGRANIFFGGSSMNKYC